MELLESLYLPDMLHLIASDLLIPTVILLLVFILYSLYCIGSVIVEVFTERRLYRARIPELIAKVENAPVDDLPHVIENSGLLRWQRDDLDELVSYLYLPEDGRVEVAKRLLANEEDRTQKVVGHTEIAAKVSPMLGLMGTLIPLGPGLVALGTGDVTVLAQSLLVAFDTTIAGLATAIVCFTVSRIRARWYDDYLVSMEGVMTALLERARMAHEQGHSFPRVVVEYRTPSRGRKRGLEEEPSAKSKIADNAGAPLSALEGGC